METIKRHPTLPTVMSCRTYPISCTNRNRLPCPVDRQRCSALHLMACSNVSDYAEHDNNTVAYTARIMVQDVADVFTVIERRGFDSPAVS